jgi:hypothetical protein
MTASVDSAAANVLVLLATAEEGQREHVNPYLTGIGSFVFLVFCLAVTLAFNRDR